MIFLKKVSFLVLVAVFMMSSVALAALTMPAELEAEFTQYPGSVIENTVDAGAIVQVILNCGDDTIDDVYDYYRGKATGNEWVVQAENKSAEAYILLLKKGSNSGNISVAVEDEGTTATISIMKE